MDSINKQQQENNFQNLHGTEAIKRIKDIDPNEPIQYRDEIIGFRNILVHGYHIIDDGTVWSILKNYLNPLKEQLLRKLDTE